MAQISIANKLAALRELMKKQRLDFYFVPARDPHNDEYVPAHWQRRAWISDFTGSAGDALIAQDSAYLWTDPRYFLQANQQLDLTYFKLMKQQHGVAPPIDVWFSKHAAGKKIGVDPKLISIKQATAWEHVLQVNGGKLIAIEENLIDSLWENRFPYVPKPIRIQKLEYAGESVENKLVRVRRLLKENQAEAHVITMLDAIAWLFNIRGQDIVYNPVAISYAIVTMDEARIFLHEEALTNEVKEYFKDQKISVTHYDDFKTHLQQLRTTVLLEPDSASFWVSKQLKRAEIILAPSPITYMKAIKNETEQQGAFEAHRRDAIAVVKLLHWLENNWQEQTEASAAEKAETFRKEDPHCHDLSFSTISAFAEHGAIIHYSVTAESNKEVHDKNLFLIDSGGQYYEGTTDITRTIHLGKPTPEQKKHYTLVLKGHLALNRLFFPEGTRGEDINAIAHMPLWQEGLDYEHGTGHGVGSNLNVHEGPQRISKAQTNVALQPGMIVSNEPGVYLAGQYGIRIENLCLIKEVITKEQSLGGHGPFYQLENLTKVPYARKLIAKELLTAEEITQINSYHQNIYELLHKDLSNEVIKWLKNATKPL